jgi:hypothetical protein
MIREIIEIPLGLFYTHYSKKNQKTKQTAGEQSILFKRGILGLEINEVIRGITT